MKNRTRDLPACSAVPELAALPRADSTLGQMLKCQWWLRGSLMCNICYRCSMCGSKIK